MKYNHDYLDLKYGLVKSFLIPANRSILDISYAVAKRQVTIQIILIDGGELSDSIRKTLNSNLPGYDIEILEKYVTKEQFNDNRGEWQPKYYSWLDNLLFAKAEAL